jgi:hypothetical protein
MQGLEEVVVVLTVPEHEPSRRQTRPDLERRGQAAERQVRVDHANARPQLNGRRDRLGGIRDATDELEPRIELDGAARAFRAPLVQLRDEHADLSVGEDRHLVYSGTGPALYGPVVRPASPGPWARKKVRRARPLALHSRKTS